MRSRLVGRQDELAVLVDGLRSAAGGAGRVAIVEGEPGGGKTRLLDELRAAAAADGFEVAAGSADELSVDRPFGAVAGALGLDSRSPDPERAEIGRMVAGAASADGPGERASEGPADLGYLIVEQVVALVEKRCAAGPVLLILEDLHWADAMTLRVVRALGRAAPQLPLALCVSLRPYPSRSDVERVTADLVAEGAARVALGPLGPAHVADLASDVAGADVAARLAAHLGRAGGNPLFVVELVGALQDDGPVEPPVVPSTVQAAIARRIGLMPATTIEILKVASVLGADFAVAELAAAMATTPVQLLGDLEAALGAGLLDDDGQGALAFRHDLIRDAVYEALPAPIRKGLHREVARVLAAMGAPDGRVAEHLFSGASPGDADAIEWLARAGRQAASRSPATAAALLERALALADPTRPEVDELACELVPLLIQTGRAAEAQQLSRQVLDRSPAPDVAARLRRAMGEVLWTKGWLEAALGELDRASDHVGAAALAAFIRLFVGAPAEAERQARAVLDDAGRQGDDFAASLALQTLALAAAAEGDVAAALPLAEEGVGVAHRSTQPYVGQLHPHLYLGLVLIQADRLADAESALQEGRRRAEVRGAVVWLPLYHWGLALRRIICADWDDALAEIEVGLAIADDVGTRLHVPLLHGMASYIALGRGDLLHAQARLDDAVREFLAGTSEAWQTDAAKGMRTAGPRWPIEWGLWIAALLHEARGDRAQALGLLEDAWAASAPLRYLIGFRFFGPDLVRLALAAGNVDLAAAVTAEVEEGARRSATATAAAAALRCRGLLEGDADALLAAIEQLRPQPALVELALALEDAGTMLAGGGAGVNGGATGRPAEAQAVLEEALLIYDRAGAARLAARAEAALRALGVRRRKGAGAAGRPATGWDSLTTTELVVARLAAEGLTNRQVGERLFVSRRTVETHLAHVFAKLDVSGRAQLAAEVARHA